MKQKLFASLTAACMTISMLPSMTLTAFASTTLTVDKTSAANGTTTFNTIHEAVEKAEALKPSSEADRVTINVNPGTYEEQVRINGAYITLQQAPGTEANGKVDLNWYYCTGYAASNCDVDGSWQPGLDWTADSTWVDPNEKIELGKEVPAGTTLRYKVNGVEKSYTVTNAFYLGDTGRSYGGYLMAPLIVENNAHDITVKDFNIVNSVPVMVTQGQKDAHLTPTDGFPNLPDRNGKELTVCDENTPEKRPSEFTGQVDINAYKNLVAGGKVFDAGESAWLTRSSVFNERGHAVSLYGDKITLENVRLRGNQDSLYICNGRDYFKNCDVIGGTDYIYGSATAVFDNCKLGLAGNSDRVYGSPIATAQTPTTTPYGYLFYNCTLYNIRNNGGEHNFGGSWNSDGQITYYNCVLDDKATVGKSAFKLAAKGWGRFNAELGLHRLYEYGTTNNSGDAVDLSQRVVNKSVEEGGPGMGTVLDEWKVLEFNPRNYFAAKNTNKNWKDDWDPMEFGKNLEKVDEAIKSVNVTIPQNEDVTFDLPTPPAGIEYKWESSSPNAVVSEDGKTITVIRPAAGEASISSEVTLYARDKSNTQYGDKQVIPVTITPTTNTSDVFNMPVNITASAALAAAYDYNITISRSGAVIKQQTITMPAGETTASGTIENIPANAAGIDYDVKVISTSDEITITTPEDGVSTVTGKTGNNVTLDIIGQKQVDKSVRLDVSYSSNGGAKTPYNLIELAKSAGADDSISTSDIITVEYDLTVPSELNQNTSYIDLISTTPASSINTNAVNSRFAFWRIYKGWTQLDMADCATGFGGTSDTDDQWLNIAGKFDYKTVTHVVTTIDYKNQVVSASASGSNQSKKEFKFASFPTNYTKGSLYLAMYPAGADVWSVDNVKVTYKAVVSSDEPIVVPDGTGIYEFPGTREYFDEGNLGNDSSVYTFIDSVDEKIKAVFADSNNKNQVASKFTEHNLSWIGGTYGHHPSLKFNAKAGKYKVFYLGYNSDANITATIDGVTVTAERGTDFATNSSKILKLYTFDIETATDAVDKKITFDSPSSFLPDLYAVVIVGKAEIDPTPTTPSKPVVTKDKTVALDINANAAGGNQTYNLIDFAKAAGASDDIMTSDIIAVEFDVKVNEKLSKDGFIDISSGTPSNANGAVAQRFTVFKINQSWEQIDAVDNTQGFSGIATNDNQRLNITGKYEKMYPASNHIKAIINYKERTITIDGDANGGSGKTATPHTFTSFPANAAKGNVNMGWFVGNTGDNFELSNVKVTYKAVVTEQVAEKITESKDKKGADAAAYMATFNDYSGKLNALSWRIEKAGNSAVSKTTEPEEFSEVTEVTNTTVVVGLVVTADDLSTIGTVTAIIE